MQVTQRGMYTDQFIVTQIQNAQFPQTADHLWQG